MVYATFYVLRKAEKNPKQKMLHKIKLLWRPELGTYSGSESFAGIQAEKQRFCPQKIMEKYRKTCCINKLAMNCLSGITRRFNSRLMNLKKR